MKIFFLLIAVLSLSSFPQDKNSVIKTFRDFHSPANIKKFADFLFCGQDYLRSIDEYKTYLQTAADDTVEFKIGLALSRMKKYQEAADYFAQKRNGSAFSFQNEIEYEKALLQSGNYNQLRMRFPDSIPDEIKRLDYLSYLYTNDSLPPEKDFLSSFPGNEIENIGSFYEWKNNPPVKCGLTAVILSTLIPGAGKFYIEQYGDGIAAFAATLLFGYLSYDNLKADHKFRGWFFAGISAFFYAGNIYGSAAGVQIYNAKLYFDFYKSLNLYLERQNYFVPEYNFCK